MINIDDIILKHAAHLLPSTNIEVAGVKFTTNSWAQLAKDTERRLLSKDLPWGPDSTSIAYTYPKSSISSLTDSLRLNVDKSTIIWMDHKPYTIVCVLGLIFIVDAEKLRLLKKFIHTLLWGKK